MIYVFLSLLSIVTDNLTMAYALKSVPLVPLIALWCTMGAWMSILPLAVDPPRKAEFYPLIKHWRPLTIYFTLSILGMAFWGIGIQQVGVGVSSMVVNSRQIFLLVIGIVFFRERFGLRIAISMLLVFSGLFMLSFRVGASSTLGVTYAFLAMGCYMGQQVVTKVLAQQLSSRVAVCIRAVVMSLLALVFMMAIGETWDFPLDSHLIVLVLLGAGSGIFLNKYFDFRASETVPMSRFALWQSMKPVLIIILAILLLNEAITIQKLLGGSLIFAGLVCLAVEDSPALRGSWLKHARAE